ncbi:hypothetical protein B0H13DRAFT_2284337 [Mycena leptocephala]|nr:hypothetical protein B0H13DRAFT_2284337 [Mycena leptocephala]
MINPCSPPPPFVLAAAQRLWRSTGLLFVLTPPALPPSERLPHTSLQIPLYLRRCPCLTRHFRRDYSGFQASPAVLALFPALAPAPTHCQLAAALSPRHAAALYILPRLTNSLQPPALPYPPPSTSICAYVPPATACATSFARRSPFFDALYPTGPLRTLCPNTDPSELRLLIPFRKPVTLPYPPRPIHQCNYAPRQRSIPLPAPPSTPARPSRPPLLPYFDAGRRLCAPALRRPARSRRLHLPAIESYAAEHPPQPTP